MLPFMPEHQKYHTKTQNYISSSMTGVNGDKYFLANAKKKKKILFKLEFIK